MVSTPEKGRRLAERVREIVSHGIATAKDPRIGFVTITDVRMSKDNDVATVYYTVLPDTDEDKQRSAAGLQSARGLLRRELGQALHVRHTPDIEFVADDVAESSRRIDAILDDLDLDQGDLDRDDASGDDGTASADL